MTNLFKISTTDLTPWEDTAKHAVNREDVYEEWTDGNWIDHRVIARTRITGTVVLSFARPADWTAFLTLLNTAKDPEGFYQISVYCSNTGTTESINAYLTIDGVTKWDLTSPRIHQGVTIGIVGR